MRLRLAKVRDTILLNLPLRIRRIELSVSIGFYSRVFYVDPWKPASEALRRFSELEKLQIHIIDLEPEKVQEGEGICALYFPELHAKGALDVDIIGYSSDLW